MEIEVKRFTSDAETTISLVLVNGVFQCFGLEDEFRYEKKHSETRIPAGTYDLGIRRVGGFHDRYKKMFSAFHEGMIEVLNVPNFKYILIHIGNTDKDTGGCLLVGTGAMADDDMSISASKRAYKRFYNYVIYQVKAGNATITYTDDDL